MSHGHHKGSIALRPAPQAGGSGPLNYPRDGCPICKSRKQRCYLSQDGQVAFCFYQGDPSQAIQTVHGDTAYKHRLDGGAKSRPPFNPKVAGPAPTIADVETRHAVYSAMLADPFFSDLPLYATDRANLNARGLPDDQIERLQYRTLWSKGRQEMAARLAKLCGADATLRVPGFVRNGRGELTLAGLDGMLAPVRDATGRLMAMMIRISDPEKAKEGKYRVLTSNRKGRPGPSPGILAHVPLGSDINSSGGVVRLTEGVIKADVATYLSGLPTIGLTGGAGNWAPGIDVLKSIEARVVRIAYDADARTNKDVANGLANVVKAARREGIEVELEVWDGAIGKGIDDFLAAGGTPEVVRGEAVDAMVREIAAQAGAIPEDAPSPTAPLADRVLHVARTDGAMKLYANAPLMAELAELEQANKAAFIAIKTSLKGTEGFTASDFNSVVKSARKPKEVAESSLYKEEDGCLKMLNPEDYGPAYVELCNFVARIVNEIARDDGVSRVKVFEIEACIRGGETHRIEVSATKFGDMKWVVPALGGKAIMGVGRMYPEHARACIQTVSGDIPRKIVYTMTGWVPTEGGYVYLTKGGAIRADGLDPTVLVDLGTNFASYDLPAPPEGDRVAEVVRAQLDLQNFGYAARPGSRGLASVLVVAAPRAVLGHANFSFHFAGMTGSHKTCAAAIAASGFGPGLNRRALPVGWDSTENAIGEFLFTLKDSLLVVDDYVERGTDADVARIRRTAERVFRTQGNGHGKQRMNADGSIRPTKPPRGLLISTGEDRIGQRSAAARMLVVPFTAARSATDDTGGTVHRDTLTAAQRHADAGVYAEATAAFIRWLAPRLDEVQEEHARRTLELRSEMATEGDHARTGEILADLTASFDIYLRFAREVGAIHDHELEPMLEEFRLGLAECERDAREDAREQEDISERYLSLLRDSLRSGDGYLVNQAGGVPTGAESQCGWHRDELGRWAHKPGGERIGWHTATEVFLLPDATYKLLLRIATIQKEPFAGRKEVHRHLLKSGKLSRHDRILGVRSRVTVEGAQHPLICLRASALWPEGLEDTPPEGPV